MLGGMLAYSVASRGILMGSACAPAKSDPLIN